jgi:hypothetical protein
LEQFNFLGA